MDKPIIQFDKSDHSNIDHIDDLFRNYFSIDKSSLDIYLESRVNLESWSGRHIFGPRPKNIPWVIIDRQENRKIGEIIYQPSPKRDFLLFHTDPEFIQVVDQLVDEMKKMMESLGFIESIDKQDLDGLQELLQENYKEPGHPGLTKEEWLERLEKAEEAKEIKRNNPKKTWGQICLEIDWQWGKNNKTKVKQLYEARMKLEQLQDRDPDGLLIELRKRKQ